ncbi:MAG: hypothetical protein LBR93_06360 [Treponema sp.]|nr:hypothetical protein [Treponema sp.]
MKPPRLNAEAPVSGQLHNDMDHSGYWWDPNSWRTLGPAWTYESKFWPQGVPKLPEISAERNTGPCPVL